MLAVFVIKLAVFFELGAHPLLLPSGLLDDAHYAHLASAVASGDIWLSDSGTFANHAAPPFFLSPLYIYVLALLLKISGGSLVVVRIVQILLGTAAAGLLAVTAWRWFGEAAAWWTLRLAALFGLATFYELLILDAALDPFLTALDVSAIARAIDRGTVRSWALAGAAVGLHALNRPTALIVLPLFAVVLFVWTIRQRSDAGSAAGRAAATATAFLIAGIVVIAPVTWRNWRVSHQFVPIVSTGGLNFLIGNGPEATGTFTRAMSIEPDVEGQWLGAPAVASVALGHDATAAEASRYLRGQAFAWIQAHPLPELGLAARKLRYALSSTFVVITHSYPFYAHDTFGALTICAVGPTLIVPLGLVGLVVARPRMRPGYWLWAGYVALAIVPLVMFFVAARFRLPMQTALLVPAGGAAAWFIDRVRARAWPEAGPAIAATAAIALFVGWPTGLDDGRAEERVRMGLFDIRTGRDADGEAWIAKALPNHGAPVVVHLRAGQLYESMNRPADAIVHYQAGLALAPAEPSLHFAMGRALFGSGDDARAVDELQRARSGPQGDAATRVLVLALSRLGRRDEANQVVRTLDPARWNADQAREFAVGLANAGRVDLSVAAWQRAADASGDARDYERLGLTWIVLNRPADAVGPFERAVQRAPTTASIRLNYAVALYSVGRRDDALRETQRVLEIDPTYAKAQQFLQVLQKK